MSAPAADAEFPQGSLESAWRDWHDDGTGAPCPDEDVCLDGFVSGVNWGVCFVLRLLRTWSANERDLNHENGARVLDWTWRRLCETVDEYRG